MKTVTMTQDEAVHLSYAVIVFAGTSTSEEDQVIYEVGHKLFANDDDIHDITVELTDDEAALFARITAVGSGLERVNAQLTAAEAERNYTPALTKLELTAIGKALIAYGLMTLVNGPMGLTHEELQALGRAAQKFGNSIKEAQNAVTAQGPDEDRREAGSDGLTSSGFFASSDQMQFPWS